MRALPRAFALMGRDEGGPARPAQDQAVGVALICAAVLCFTLMDATAKRLGAHYHPAQIVWARFAVNMMILLVIFRSRTPSLIRSRQPGLQFARALTQVASVGLFFTSLQFIGLAEATAIMDTNPVLITLGAALFLGERIGPRRILGIAAAMIGALIIIRPGMGVFQPAALLPLIGAFTYASGALLTRIVRSDSAATSILWSTTVGFALSSVVVPFFWTPVAAGDLPFLLALGTFGTLSQWLLIRAFSVAEAGSLAPFGYTGLVWAAIWGWLFFRETPDLWTITGAAIIVGAGLYVWSREARAHRSTA